MPGNDADGGFATHVVVPARDLVALDDGPGVDGPLGRVGLEAWQLGPVADAVSTAHQAIVRAGLAPGDVAVFVGVGGVGGFGAQIAKSFGAKVVAIDVDARRLAALGDVPDEVVATESKDARSVRDLVRARVAARGWRGVPVRIFETSGSPAGQAVAWELLERGGSLSVVGFTMEKMPLRLSNVMALDADVHGNWGCDPSLYPDLVRRVLDGAVRIAPFVEGHPLDSVNDVLEDLRAHRLTRRAVLVP
jgi:6-hydroxycyclohex-1-ene-1-carbonyl-CoA dehydrogenase